MAADTLYWRSLRGPYDPKLLVKGTELFVALFGRNSRFAVYEVRCYDEKGFADREYIVRDAEAISDADVAAGKRPPIVGRTRDYDKLLSLVARFSAEQGPTP